MWGDGDPEGVRQRASAELVETAKAAKRFGVDIVNGFTGSSIWHLLYSFPPVSPNTIAEGYADFGRRFTPILDEFHKLGVRFALEVHPTEIAFDVVSAERAIEALDGHPAFGFNYDPSHLGYQGVDYVKFIYRFSRRIFHVHMKDVAPGKFCIMGRGMGLLDFGLIRETLLDVGYTGWVIGELGSGADTGTIASCYANREYLRSLGY